MKRSLAAPLLSKSLLVAAIAAAGIFSPPNRASAEPAPAGDVAAEGIEDLHKTLAEVLRARRPEEFAFLDRVVELVDQGTLPRSLVVSTFNWARKKPRHPFQYFEFGLRERAKRIGVDI